MHGPFSVRAWSVQSPFNSRLTSVFIKRSSVKRIVHGRFFLAHTVILSFQAAATASMFVVFFLCMIVIC